MRVCENFNTLCRANTRSSSAPMQLGGMQSNSYNRTACTRVCCAMRVWETTRHPTSVCWQSVSRVLDASPTLSALYRVLRVQPRFLLPVEGPARCRNSRMFSRDGEDGVLLQKTIRCRSDLHCTLSSNNPRQRLARSEEVRARFEIQ